MRDKVFISYAHADQEEIDWMKKLKKHLGFFERKQLLNIWEDSKLHVGGNPQQEIIDAINESKVAVLMVGPSFLGSAFINDIELPRILEAAKSDGLQIFPLITNFCSYRKSELKDIWAYNDIAKPLELLSPSEQNKVLYTFCNSLEEAYNKRDATTAEGLSGIINSIKTVVLPNRRLTCCNFTSHRNQFVCAGFEEGILNVDVESNMTETLAAIPSIARTIFRFPDSSIFLIGYDNGEIYSFNSDLVHFKKCFSCRSSVFSIEFNGESKTLITTERTGEVSEWVIKNLVEITDEEDDPQIEFLREISKHTSNAFMFTYISKLNRGTSIGADGLVLTIDFKSGKIKSDNAYKSYGLYCVSSSENGTIAIGSTQGKVFIIDQHYKRKELTLHTDTIRALALTSKATWLFTGSKDKTIKAVHLDSNKSWIVYKCKDYIYDLKFSSTYNQLLACDGSGALITLNFNLPVEEMTDQDMDIFINTSIKS
jgi:WD40 repeat protein